MRHGYTTGSVRTKFKSLKANSNLNYLTIELYNYDYLGNISNDSSLPIKKSRVPRGRNIFNKLKHHSEQNIDDYNILAPETSAMFDDDLEKLQGSSSAVPETQTQFPKTDLKHFDINNYTNETTSRNTIESLQTHKHGLINSNADSVIKKHNAELPTEHIMDMSSNNAAESPSILSFRNKTNSQVVSKRNNVINENVSAEILAAKPECHALSPNNGSESPSILSGNKCVKRTDSIDSDDSDTLSIFKTQRFSKSINLHPSKHSILAIDHHNTTASVEKAMSNNMEISMPNKSKYSLNISCKENTPNKNDTTYLNIEHKNSNGSSNKELVQKNVSREYKDLLPKHIKATNKWGIEISTDILPSAVTRAGSLKQGSIQTFLHPKSESNQSGRKRRKDDELLDEHMRHAIELSKQDAESSKSSALKYSLNTNPNSIHKNREANSKIPAACFGPNTTIRCESSMNMNNSKLLDFVEEGSSERLPLATAVDSFNCVPDTAMILQCESNLGEKPKFKYVSSPVRKKADRMKLLQGHDCKDCRDFYKGDNLTESQLADLLNKCSKHRSRLPPPPQSPQIRWNLEIEEDGPNDKTQIPSPLKTRERRKLLRKL